MDPVHSAILCGDVSGLEDLVSNLSIDCNKMNESGMRPIHTLLYKKADNNAELLSTLLKREDILINVSDEMGAIPIHMVINAADVRCLEILVTESNVDCNKVNSTGMPPVHAILRRSTFTGPSVIAMMMVIILRREDVDLNAEDDMGGIPIHMAITHGNKQVLEMLVAIPSVDCNKANNMGMNPVHTLIRSLAYIHPNVVAEMLSVLMERKDVDLNAKDIMGNTPLHLAGIHGNVKIFEMLAKEPSVEHHKLNNSGQTPLAATCSANKKNSGALLSLLLKDVKQ